MRDSMNHPTNTQRNRVLSRFIPAVLSIAVLGACNLTEPAEMRTGEDAQQFVLQANWSASATPVGSSTLRATLGIKQYAGFHMDATVQFTGAPNTVYQWRIMRGDCTVNVAAASNTAPTGLLVFATTQSYPDFTTDASGNATLTRTIAGSLDSLKQYSVRARVFAAGAWNGTNPVSCGNLQRSGGT